MAERKYQAWAAKSPCGPLCCVSSRRKEVLDKLFKETLTSWKKLYRRGWRCVKVWVYEKWQISEREESLATDLYRARGWAAVVIRQCDALGIELPEFNNWGDDIDKLMRSQTVFPKEKGQEDVVQVE